MKKRLISTLLAIAMLASLLPTAFAADTVTRAEWISQLVAAFSMTVEDDTTMPDNYFSDITESDSYYRDILLAVEFGVIDLEAGEAFKPTDPATREFAARTLNSCLQFQLDEGAEYTFSEAETVTYPDDIQIAVNRNWFALSGDNFLPEQAITSAEATAMLADAKAVIESEAIDVNYDSKFEFAEGVIVIPETVNATIDTDYTVTITDYDAQISVGDTFIVYNNSYPVALNALSVDTSDNITVISAEKAEEAITSADAEGEIDIDLENFDANELSTYSITNTETSENEEMAIELYSINYDKGSKTLTVSQKISVGSAAAGTVTVKLKNLKLKHKESLKKLSAEAIITADTTVATEVNFDFGAYAGIPSSITLGAIPIAGIGTVSLSMEYSLKGGVTMVWDGILKAGFSYDNGNFRLVKSYTKKGFSFNAEADIKAGLRLSAAVDFVLANGNIYATLGVRMNANIKSFDSGSPKTCVTTKGYMYSQVGANASAFGQNIPIKTQDIFTEYNSPVRVVYHYEDHVLVNSCSRGLDLKYTTSTSSRYFNPSPSYGQGSYGSGGVEPVVIWEYEVEDGNATITKYNGNASAVAVPSMIDGYTVTKIGDSAFEGNESIRTVTMPNSITRIGSYVFYQCINLCNVQLPAKIEAIDSNTFYDCESLTEIFIPKTLKEGGGAFDHSGIVSAEFEDGATIIPSHVFWGCSNLKRVTMPDTVITIEGYAFGDCVNLTDVTLPSYITTIDANAFRGCESLTKIFIPKSLEEGGGAFDASGLITADIESGMTVIPDSLFYGCEKLKDVTIPDTIIKIGSSAFYNCCTLEKIDIPQYVTEIDGYAFMGCSKLSDVKLPPHITQLGMWTFYECESLTEINIPKSLENVNSSFSKSGLENVKFEQGRTVLPEELFRDCHNLKKIVIPDTVKTIEGFVFDSCTSLTDITIPDSVTTIGNYAFSDCTSLKGIIIPNSVTDLKGSIFQDCIALEKVTLPDLITEIQGNMFENCQSLIDIKIPQTVTDIYGGAFSGCSSIEEIILPKSLRTINPIAFSNCLKLKEITIPSSVERIYWSAFENCDALETVTVNAAYIDPKAFYDCDALTTLTLGDGVTEIGSELCYGCENLTDINFGKYIIEIPDSAFRQCQSLTSVALPRFCTKVAANAFAEDTKLTSAYVPVTVSSIENNSFSYPAKMTMYGKSGSYAEEYANSRNMTFSAVSAPITSMSYADNAVEIGIGEKIRPTLNIEPAFDTSTVTFASSDENICTVSETGEIYGKNYGTATVTATSDSGVKAEIAVNIVRLADSVSLDKTELALETGDTSTLTATLNPSDATDKITWKSSNENVATVDNGTVTAVGAGTAVITVTTTGGKTASCTVNVIGTFTVTATAGENGTISPSGDVSVRSDEKKTFNILPDYGYVAKDVLVNGASVGAVESYTFSNLTDNATITVEFAKIDAAYENGTVTISSEVALKDLKLIIATYDDEGRLTDCEIKTVTATAGESYQDTVTEAENMKLMLWSGLDTMRPIWCNK